MAPLPDSRELRCLAFLFLLAALGLRRSISVSLSSKSILQVKELMDELKQVFDAKNSLVFS